MSKSDQVDILAYERVRRIMDNLHTVAGDAARKHAEQAQRGI